MRATGLLLHQRRSGQIEGNQVVFTPIPPRSRFPVKVTVVAWQYGVAGKVQTAEPVERSFYILKPSGMAAFNEAASMSVMAHSIMRKQEAESLLILYMAIHWITECGMNNSLNLPKSTV